MGEDIKFSSKIVVDASVFLAFLLPDEKRRWIDRLFIEFKKGKIDIIAPKILYFEVLNGIKSSLISKRITKALAKRLIRRFIQVKIDTWEIDWLKTFNLSLKHNLSFYDAAYIYLAKDNKLPFLSLDRKLKSFAKSF